MRSIEVLSYLMMLKVIIVVVMMSSGVQGDPSIKQTRSLTSNMLPTLYKLFLSDPRFVECFVITRKQSAECVEAYNDDINIKRSVGEVQERSQEVMCEGRRCERSRFLDETRPDEPYTGPKRFYNNW